MTDRDLIKQMRDALRLFTSSCVAVSTELDERGHSWSEAYLDQALPVARSALAAYAVLAQPEPKHQIPENTAEHPYVTLPPLRRMSDGELLEVIEAHRDQVAFGSIYDFDPTRYLPCARAILDKAGKP